MSSDTHPTLLLCLHGWGGSKESFTELRAALNDANVEMLIPDLPGFGEQPEPIEPMHNDDYAKWVEEWVRQQTDGNQPIAIVAHSHGGRIAMKLAVRGNLQITHLFLCAPAGIKHARHIKRVIGLTLAKIGGALLKIPGLRALQPLGKKLLYKLVRVHDYENASPVMRQTLINVTQEDLRPLLKNIEIPTDLFWGTEDGMTPYSDARIMEQAIPHATLHTYEGVRHRVHRDRANDIAQIIKTVLMDETQ